MGVSDESDSFYETKMLARSDALESLISLKFPDLVKSARTYNNEAIQARRLLANDIASLPKGARVLEVGAGSLALSLQLASEGFAVTAVEPVGSGFSPMRIFIEEYLHMAGDMGMNIDFHDSKIEDFNSSERYDYGFCINVLEHVNDPARVINHVMSLDITKFRIYFPNYNFPYEPHFGKFLWERKNGAFYLPLSRAKNSNLVDEHGMYNSINYVTYKKVMSICSDSGINAILNKNVNEELLRRALNDPILESRHRMLANFAKVFNKLHLAKVFKILPLRVSPLIDITLARPRLGKIAISNRES